MSALSTVFEVTVWIVRKMMILFTLVLSYSPFVIFSVFITVRQCVCPFVWKLEPNVPNVEKRMKSAGMDAKTRTTVNE